MRILITNLHGTRHIGVRLRDGRTFTRVFYEGETFDYGQMMSPFELNFQQDLTELVAAGKASLVIEPEYLDATKPWLLTVGPIPILDGGTSLTSILLPLGTTAITANQMITASIVIVHPYVDGIVTLLDGATVLLGPVSLTSAGVFTTDDITALYSGVLSIQVTSSDSSGISSLYYQVA